MVQLLKDSFTILEEYSRSDIKRGKENDISQRKIRPINQGEKGIRKRFYMFDPSGHHAVV
jgi:hypothetical protein